MSELQLEHANPVPEFSAVPQVQELTDSANYVAAYADFIAQSPTSAHTVALAAQMLTAAGFSRLHEADVWPRLEPGAAQFTVRDGAIIAWRAGADTDGRGVLQPGFAARIFGAHTDSPGFVVKPEPGSSAHGWQQLNVEVYGGPLLNSWLDRDLAIAGRVQLADGTSRLIHTGPVARIPQLAFHLDREVNDALRLRKQQHMHPVLTTGEQDALTVIAAAAGVDATQIAGFELHLADTQAPALIGADTQLFAAGRQDNLSGTFAGLAALLAADVPAGQVALFVSYDHEEVGSLTYSGAQGTFLQDVLTRLNEGVGGAAGDLVRTKARSWILSCDSGHGVHPNYPEKHDPAVRPQLGAGPMRKVNANQHYATDASGAYVWQRVCAAAGVSGQVFVSNNESPCGTTIGPIAAAVVGIRTVDVGVPLLSMHSARELAHVDDLYAMGLVAREFYALGTEVF